MTKLSAINITHLNNSMKAAKDVALGTLLSSLESASATLTPNMVVSGSQVLTAVHTNASAVTLDTGLGTVKGYIAQMTSSGSSRSTYTRNSSGSIIFAADSSGSYVLASGDIASYVAW